MLHFVEKPRDTHFVMLRKARRISNEHPALRGQPVLAYEGFLPDLVRLTSTGYRTFAGVAKELKKTPQEIAGMVAGLHRDFPDGVEFKIDTAGRVDRFRIDRRHVLNVAKTYDYYVSEFVSAMASVPASFDDLVQPATRQAGDAMLNGEDASLSAYFVAEVPAFGDAAGSDTPKVVYSNYPANAGHGKKLLRELHVRGVAVPYRVHIVGATVAWGDVSGSVHKDENCEYETIDTTGSPLLVGRSIRYAIEFKAKTLAQATQLVTALNELVYAGKANAIGGSWEIPDLRVYGLVSAAMPEMGRAVLNWKVMGKKKQELSVLSTQKLQGWNTDSILLGRVLKHFIASTD